MTESVGTRISTAADFPTVAVYARSEPEGPVYTVAFTNHEFGTVGRLAVGGALATAGVVSVIPSLVITLFGGFQFYAGTITLAVAYVAVLTVLNLTGWFRVFPPYPYPVTVELDFGRDRITVKRKGRRLVERTLSALHNLTVEDHPDAEHSRRNRELRGEKRLSNNEKQHCLFGWFGGGGAEQVPLVTRMEWPNRNSLFEVRQAILWTNEKARSQAAQEFETEGRGIKPPLD
jgi:hypothetical protein